MSQIAQPEHTRLYFAVLDGQDPALWRPFKTAFGEVIEGVRRRQLASIAPAPYAEVYPVEFQAILAGVGELLGSTNLDQIVGVIVDAIGPDAVTAARCKAVTDVFRSLCKKQKALRASAAKPLYSRIGRFEVWFVAEENQIDQIEAELVPMIREIVSFNLDTKVRHEYIVAEFMLADAVRDYLNNAVYDLAEAGGQ